MKKLILLSISLSAVACAPPPAPSPEITAKPLALVQVKNESPFSATVYADDAPISHVVAYSGKDLARIYRVPLDGAIHFSVRFDGGSKLDLATVNYEEGRAIRVVLRDPITSSSAQ